MSAQTVIDLFYLWNITIDLFGAALLFRLVCRAILLQCFAGTGQEFSASSPIPGSYTLN